MTEQFYNHVPCMASRDGYLVCDQEKGHDGMHGDHRKEDPVYWMDDIKYMIWSDNNDRWMEVPYTLDPAPVRIKENNDNNFS